jgi:ribose/xylose/arabinose/galactoside ABC-type transport system permease subunit
VLKAVPACPGAGIQTMHGTGDVRVKAFVPHPSAHVESGKRPIGLVILGRLRSIATKLLCSEYLLLYLTVAYLLVATQLVPGLLSSANLRSVLSNLFPLLIAAIGQSFVLITAGIDLSVTSVFACSSVVGGWIMTSNFGPLAESGWSLAAGLLAMFAVAVGVGLINGLSITQFQMPPFIVTLSTMTFFAGVALWMVRSRNIYHLPKFLLTIGKGSVAFVPYALLVTSTLVWVAYWVLTRTILGRWLFAVGYNAKAAVNSGVPISRTIIFAYVASAICAALATILLMGRLETASPIIGQRLLLDVIAAPVIGGVSLFGGRGKIQWVILGALFVTLMDNSLNLLGLSSFVIMMAKGGLILFAALLDVFRNASSVST